jgi:hypothetical protein
MDPFDIEILNHLRDSKPREFKQILTAVKLSHNTNASPRLTRGPEDNARASSEKLSLFTTHTLWRSYA